MQVTIDLNSSTDREMIRKLLTEYDAADPFHPANAPVRNKREIERLLSKETGKFLVKWAQIPDAPTWKTAATIASETGLNTTAVEAYIRITGKFSIHHKLAADDIFRTSEDSPRKYALNERFVNRIRNGKW